MNIGVFAFGPLNRMTDLTTHPLERLVARLRLSLVVAGTGLPPPRFAAIPHPDTPSGASNYGF